MPNHVHLILTPAREDGLGLAVGEAHRRYTNSINARARWTGHLFQSRFASVVMHEIPLLAAVSYVSLNPVRADLAGHAADWAWSSVRAHLTGKDDGLVTVRPVLDRVSCFADLLLENNDEAFAALRRAKAPGVRWGRRSLSPDLNACLDGGLRAVLPVLLRQPGMTYGS
jgi:putative transposase